MTCKPPPYNEKIHRMHDPKGVCVRLAHRITGDQVWEGPVKKSLTLQGLAEKLRSGDEPVCFYYKDIEIPSDCFGQRLQLLHNQLADEQTEGEPAVLELHFFFREGKDSGLLKATAKGGTQSMETALEAMNAKMIPSEVQERCTEALLMACKNGDPEKVKLLVAARADMEAKDKFGNTPLLVAAGKGHEEAQLCLIKAGANLCSIFLLAAQKGNKGTVQRLLDLHATLETRDPEGHTALLLATRNGSLGTVVLLLSRNANIHATNSDWTTALQLAAGGGHAEIITELVKWGAAVNGSNKYGFTSLHFALEGKNKEVVKLLLDGTADANAWTKDGMTPILHVASSGQADLVDLLVEKEADMTVQVKGKGSTALKLAARRGHATTAERIQYYMLQKLIGGDHGDSLSIWQRRLHARQVKKVEDEISSAVQIAQKKQHRSVIQLLKPKEPMDRGSTVVSS